MARRRHTPEQTIRKTHREGEKLLNEGKGIDEVCKHLEVSAPTWHRWVAQNGGDEGSGRQTPEGVGEAESADEEDRGRSGGGHRHAQGVQFTPTHTAASEQRQRGAAASLVQVLQHQFRRRHTPAADASRGAGLWGSPCPLQDLGGNGFRFDEAAVLLEDGGPACPTSP